MTNLAWSLLLTIVKAVALVAMVWKVVWLIAAIRRYIERARDRWDGQYMRGILVYLGFIEDDDENDG